MPWRDHGSEHQLVDEDGAVLARVFKSGCCWFAAVTGSAVSGRFKHLDEAKKIVRILACAGPRVKNGD